MKRILLLLVFLLLSVQAGYAIKLTPAGIGIQFTPNFERTFTFRTDTDPNIDISLSGELSKYTEVVANTIEKNGEFQIRVKLPETIETPGDNIIYVGVSRFAGEGTVSAVESVMGAIVIKVPFPGIYANFAFYVSDLNRDEVRNFQVEIVNKGKLNFTASGVIEIFNDKNISVEKLHTEEKFIPAATTGSLNALFNASNHFDGNYKAVATVEYGDKTIVLEKSFKIGRLHVKLINYTNTFEPYKINLFKILVESEWNNPIKDVYADVNIYNGTKRISSFKTPNINVEPWGIGELSAFWDASEIREGAYALDFTINYEGISDRYEGTVVLEKEKGGIPFYKKINMVSFLVVITIILLIFNIILLRKKGAEKNRK